jgi:hypothetical protein
VGKINISLLSSTAGQGGGGGGGGGQKWGPGDFIGNKLGRKKDYFHDNSHSLSINDKKYTNTRGFFVQKRDFSDTFLPRENFLAELL